MALFIEILISLLVFFGAIFLLGGAVGILRFPDVYCRMHALGKGTTMGIICFMLAAFIYFCWSGVGVCIMSLLALVFISVSAPIGSHMIAKAAYHYGIPLWQNSLRDDLKPDCEFISEDKADF
ncbi:MAG: monovalent cation/H(+) antiporter subunit G [Firmicutes bacterium]|nr:monovalent cation/H(+) antiporter subunit G [Bacillota bacterium]